MIVLAILLCSARIHLQTPAAQVRPLTIHGTVVDASGFPVPSVQIRASTLTTSVRALSGADGSWTLVIAAEPPVHVVASAPGFRDAARVVTDPAVGIRIQLVPQAVTEHVTVTGGARQRLVIESSATVLDRRTLANAPAIALDDQLRTVPGFSLFRRTSSLAANPTTQGVTLRGMSASGASRTLVVAGGVPLNDPFGGWVYWDRIPVAALDSVTVGRGAASDVHGNDALGGVISIDLRTSPGADIRIEAGNEATSRFSGYGGAAARGLLAGAAAESLRTDGYVVVAPESRGSIDVPAGVDARSAMGWLDSRRGALELDGRGGYSSENRRNGTPAQVNATIARWGAANVRGFVAGGAWEARADTTATTYRQTFSAVNAARDAERLTTLQWVTASSTGAAATWIRSRGRSTALLSASTRYWRADLKEAAVAASGSTAQTLVTPASQRSDGFAFQARFDRSPRSVIEGGVRVEAFHSSLLTPAHETTASYAVDPRLTFSSHLTSSETLRISWLSGFRGPTMNELFRSFRVGNALTLANAALRPERTWGPEVALTSQRGRWTARTIGYVTKLTDAIYSRTLSSGATIMRQRSNADARAIGSELELEWRAAAGFALASSWAFTDSRFVSGDLDGRRIPQVPRAQGTIGVRLARARADAALDVRVFSSQFDDDVNAFDLRGGSLTAARLGGRLTRHLEVFSALENAFDADIDTGRTPIRTVGAPRSGRAGLRLLF